MMYLTSNVYQVSRINRNIMECKDESREASGYECICINRNIMECKGISEYDGENPKGRINRNIMECKGISAKSRQSGLSVLIETLWNVKLFIAAQIHFSQSPY